LGPDLVSFSPVGVAVSLDPDTFPDTRQARIAHRISEQACCT
jgi:hypothetical protein